MSVLALGVNHKTAPVQFRERVAFPGDDLPVALRALRSCDGVREAAILSTCNRTDLYCGVETQAPDSIVGWLGEYHGLSRRELEPHLYVHRSHSAVRHVMRVASGLDSLVLGEPQIFGQLKSAYAAAHRHGTVGAVLGKLFQHTFSVAKRVRTDTSIGASPVSVAFAAVSLARQIFGRLEPHTALLIGAGETIELAARHLAKYGLGRMIVANRTIENAHRVAVAFGGYAIALNEIPLHLAEADIVVAATGSPGVLVTLEQVEAALEARKRQPMFMVDVAVPQDIDPAAGHLEDVFLYTIDDLHDVIEEGRRSRAEGARQAEEIIDRQVAQFMGWLGTRDVADTIRGVRRSAELTRDAVLDRARRRVASGASAEEALQYLAHTLTNKLLHNPTVHIRHAGADAREDIVEAARVLFELDDDADSPA